MLAHQNQVVCFPAGNMPLWHAVEGQKQWCCSLTDFQLILLHELHTVLHTCAIYGDMFISEVI